MMKNKDDRTILPIEASREDLVEKLLNLADSGPEIPARGADQIKAAVRPVWQKEVNRSSRRVWVLGLAAAVALAFVLTYDRIVGPANAGPVATIEAVVVTVEVEGSEGIFESVGPERAGLSLDSGSWLETGEGAHAALRLADGHLLRLDNDTRVRLLEPREIHLGRGAVYLDSADATAGPVTVHSTFGTVRDIGTRFEVRAGEAGLRVSVRDGRVEIESDDFTIEVPVGRALTVNDDGSTEVRPLRADAPEWAWVMKAGPAFEIEGRSVMEFLTWVGDETGLRIQFEDPAVASLAASTILHGRSEGLSPVDAPSIVLPATGMTSTVAGGSLTVFATR